MESYIIHKIMEGLSQHLKAFDSKGKFQIAFSSQFQATAPAYRVRLGVQPVQSVPNIVDIWAKDYETQNVVAIDLAYPTAKQRMVLVPTGTAVFLPDYPEIDTAKSEFREAIEKLEWAVAAQLANKGFAILLTNQPKLWEDFHEKITTTDHITPSRTYDINWKDYSSLTWGENPCFWYLVVEIKP